MSTPGGSVLSTLVRDGAIAGLAVHCDKQQLYFFTDGEHYKVGISADPAGRLQQLQTGHPKKLRSLFRLTLPERADVAAIEKAFHVALAPWKTSGGREWFVADEGSEKVLRACLKEEVVRKLGCTIMVLE